MSPAADVLLRQLRDTAEQYYLEMLEGAVDISHEVGQLPKPIQHMMNVCKDAGISKSAIDEVVDSAARVVLEQHESNKRLQQLKDL